jgi:predicted DNA-binding transcriptional regulator YafY
MRDIEPESLTYSGEAWYVNGFCRLRNEVRSFRLERIDAMTTLDEQFTLRMVFPPPQEHIAVSIHFNSVVIRWVRERQHYAYQSDGESTPRGVVMHYCVDELPEILPWVLSWGSAAQVLTPEALRQQVRHEAKTLISLLT